VTSSGCGVARPRPAAASACERGKADVVGLIAILDRGQFV